MGIDNFVYREYAYSKKGVPVAGRVSGRKYKRTGIVSALNGKNILSPLMYDGVMDSTLFEQWFEYCLFQEIPPSSVIVLDNASFHRKSKLISLAHEYGHRVIFLPPYSPELNPIENFWAWLKAKLKKIILDFNNFNDALCYCFNIT